MTTREALRSAVGAVLSEIHGDEMLGGRWTVDEMAVEVLRAVVETLGVTREDVEIVYGARKYVLHHAVRARFDVAADALSALLDSVEPATATHPARLQEQEP